MLHRGVSLLHRDQGTSQVKIAGWVWPAQQQVCSGIDVSCLSPLQCLKIEL